MWHPSFPAVIESGQWIEPKWKVFEQHATGKVKCERSILRTLMYVYSLKLAVNLSSKMFPSCLKGTKENEINP